MAEHRAGRLAAIAVNDSWRLVPWADALYACDPDWLDHHHGAPGFWGEKWTQDREAAKRWDWSWIRGVSEVGISTDPSRIYFGKSRTRGGHNSGFQALNLAILLGARRILLLGYDMKKGPEGETHWFGDHPGKLKRTSPYGHFAEGFEAAAPEIAAAGVEVINCSRETALTCFPRMAIGEALGVGVERETA